MKINKSNIIVQYVIVFMLAIIAYSNTINHSYTWDDALVITNNKYTKKGFNGLKDIWTKKVFLHHRNVYRPVPQSIYAVTYQFFDYNPKAGHLINIITYGVLAIVTFWFLNLLFTHKNKWLLLFITLLFVLHPIHTEVVANIKSLDEILAYLFGILSLIFWMKYIRKFSLKTLFLVLVFLTLALLSKISAITFLPIYVIVLLFKKDNILIDIKNQKIKLFSLFSKDYLTIKEALFINILMLLFAFLLVKYRFSPLVVLPVFISVILSFKLNSKDFKLLYSIAIILILTFLNYKVGLIVFTLIMSFYFIKNRKFYKKYFIILNLVFAIAISLLQKDFKTSIYFFIFYFAFSFIPFLYLKKSKIFAIIFLIIAVIVPVVLKQEMHLISFASILLLIMLSIYHYKISSKLLLVVVLISLISDSYFFSERNVLDKINFSKSIVEVENNAETTQEMSPLNNSLFNENNREIKYSTIATIQLKYLQLLVFPHPLIHQYGFNQIEKTNFKNWKVWFSIIIHLLLFLFAIYKLKDKNEMSFGILFYFSTMSIYTNILVLMPDTLAERFLFTPSLGFAIIFVFFIDYLIKKATSKKIALAIIIIPILFTFTYKTFDRNKAWKNNFSLAKKTIKYAKNNAAINAQFASELYNAKHDSSEIFYYYNRALEIYPNFYSASKDLATFFIERKNTEKAEKYLLKNVSLKNRDWESYYYLGFINYDNKQYGSAVPYFENCLSTGEKIMPKEKLILATEFLGRCYFNSHQVEKADVLLKSLFSKYKSKSSIVLLGNIYNQFGNKQKALDTYIFLQEYFPKDKQLEKTIEILKNDIKNEK